MDSNAGCIAAFVKDGTYIYSTFRRCPSFREILESGDTLGFRQKFITPVQSVAARADAGIGWGERAPWEAFRGNSNLGAVPRVEQPGSRPGGGAARVAFRGRRSLGGHSGKKVEEALPQIRRGRYGQVVL